MNDGGPAFPQHGWSGSPETIKRMADKQGMTLLDFYAGEALPAIIETGVDGTVRDAAKRLGLEEGEYVAAKHFPRLCAMDAWDMAEAMIAEREKRLARKEKP